MKDITHIIRLNKESERLTYTLSELTDHGVEYTLLGYYPNLPQSYIGHDIDIYISNLNLAKKIFQKCGWVIQNYGGRHPVRAFFFVESESNWIVVELACKKNFIIQNTMKEILASSYKNSYGIFCLDKPSIVIINIIKYFYKGQIRGQIQLTRLYSLWGEISERDRRKVRKIIVKELGEIFVEQIFNLMNERVIFDRLPEDISRNISLKRLTKNSDRIVFDGKIKFLALLKNPYYIYRLIFSIFKRNKNSFPMVAVVGNDGSGKTVFCNSFKRSEFIKNNPVHIVMRRNDPILPLYKDLRMQLKNKKKSFFLFWFIEAFDFIDRMLRYIAGSLWSRSGLGLVLFERYPTDRTRGEYLKGSFSFFPLEQFFPMPNLIILFDVSAEDSLLRKPDDGHNLLEQGQKRDNYIKLMQNISPSVVIDSKSTLDEAYKSASLAIWNQCKIVRGGKNLGTAIWKK